MSTFNRPPSAARLAWLGLSWLMLAACGWVQAGEAAGSGLRFSGFGTVGLAHTASAEGWGLRREISQPEFGSGSQGDVDSRLGLQLNYAASERLELVAQVVAERRSPYVPASDSLEWAFLAWRPDADTVLRLGRVDSEFFLMSDYRNVGFAYRTVRPPVEFYGSMPTSINGAGIEHQWLREDELWRGKLFAGRGWGGDLGSDARFRMSPVFGALVSREADGLLLRAAVTYVRLATSGNALKPLVQALDGVRALPIPGLAAQADVLQSRFDYAGSHLVYYGLGASYEVHDWQWSAEATRVSGNAAVSFDAWYAGLGRRFGKLLWYAGISGIRSPGSQGSPMDSPNWAEALTPVVGPMLAQQLQAVAAAATYAGNMSHADQQTVTLGLRCDLSAQMALKLQWDDSRVGAYGSRLWSRPTARPGRARVTSAALDFVF